MSKMSFLTYLILFLIVMAGFWFRLTGIKDNHSFWGDEAFVASVTRDVVWGKKNFLSAVNTSGVNYQPLNVLLISLSFKIFGVNEFAARFPYIFFGSVGILFAFLVARAFSNNWGGYLAAFVYAFSQLNLAHSTQAKSFTLIQTFTLIVIFLILNLKKNKNNLLIHFLIILTILLAYFANTTGFLISLIYLPFLIRNNKNIFIIAALIIIFFILKIHQTLFFIFTPQNGKFLFFYNHLPYLRQLLWNNYAFISLPAFFGFLTLFKKNKLIFFGTTIWLLITLYLWTFFYYSHNVRYLLPFLGLLFVFFGVFWANIGEKLFNKKSFLICFFIIILLYAGGYKIVRKPANYYNPNADLYGDVQIADYKTAYKKINEKFPDLSQIAVFNDLIDSQRWYLEKQADAYFMKDVNKTLKQTVDDKTKYVNINAYFIKGLKKPLKHPVDGKMIWADLDDFIREKSKYKKGLLIVEDWESILPEDIKQYAKKNMKLEFRVESLPYAGEDKWPIEVYSWGF